MTIVVGHDTDALWLDIEQVVVKTLLAVLPEIQIAHNMAIRADNRATCFQILGKSATSSAPFTMFP